MGTTLEVFKRTPTGLAALGANGGPLLPSSNDLKTALGTAVLPSGDIDGLIEMKTRLYAEHGRSLPIESELRQRLTSEISEVEAAIVAAKVNHGRQSPLSYLDLDVLRWRHDRPIKGYIPVPRLALIDVRKDNVSFRVESRGVSDVTYPTVSRHTSPMEQRYVDVKTALGQTLGPRAFRSRVNSARLWFEFKGAIPGDSRALICEAQNAFESVYLLAEAPFEGWRFKQSVQTRAERRAERRAARAQWLDPLVLGYGGERLWVLGAFDTTAVEEYIRSEFTAKS